MLYGSARLRGEIETMSEAGARPSLDAAPRRLTTVVAADICGYSRLAEIDDDAAIRTVNFVRAAFESVVARRRGRLFHAAGDGFLAEFPSAADGVLAALEFVADIKARDKLSPISPGAKVRAGVHAGDVVEQPDGDLLGHGVNVAARLQAEAEPNGVLVSLAAVNLVRNSIDVRFSRRGPLALRNIDEPVVAFDAAGSRGPILSSPLAWLRRKARLSFATAAYLGLGATLVLITGATLQKTIRQEETLIKASQTKAPEPDISILSQGEKNYLDRAYLTQVLRSLLESGTDASRAVLALLETGDTAAAVKLLSDELQAATADEARYIEINHQIGAIAELAAPEQAAAAYERVLAINPKDFFAAARLAHTRLAQNRVREAERHYAQALSLGATDPKLMLQVENEAAFVHLLDRDMVAAIRAYRAIVERAADIGFDEVEISARASLGLALGFEGRETEAREQFLNVLFAQPEHLFISSRARAAWGLGQISRQAGDLRSAERFYSRSLDYETAANRAHGRASSLFGLGMTTLAFANEPGLTTEERATHLDLAEKRFNASLAIAEEQDLVFHTNMALAGLARTYALKSDAEKACEFVARSEALLNGRKISLSAVNPEVRALIDATRCPFRIVAK